MDTIAQLEKCQAPDPEVMGSNPSIDMKLCPCARPFILIAQYWLNS